MPKVRAALYLRLSRDDGRQHDESESITSQRLMLIQYAEHHGLPIVAEFADDGLSGTKWTRSGLQDLLRTIEDGLVNTVLVKDLSRLCRDYLRTGELLEHWFPAHGVRLIAVNDGVDTAYQSAGNDYSPIRAVMDDWYARDVSRKVRAAIYARQDAGICTAATLPYGYQRMDGQICVHPEKSGRVKEIFHIYEKSQSLRKSADMLNHARIPSPRNGRNGWSSATVRRILKNPAYCGVLYIHVTRKISYKSAHRIRLPEQEQIAVPVPRIVTDAQFDRVQMLMLANGHAEKQAHWLSGRVMCGACGSRFILSDGRLICGGRRRGNGCECSSVSVCDLLVQVADAFEHAGILGDTALLPLLVQRVLISCAQITVFVRCRKPSLPAGTDMCNITKCV